MKTAADKVADRAFEAKQREQRLVNAYRRAFQSEDGKVVLEDLEKVFRLKERVFMPVKQEGECFAYDPLTAALADGARTVVIHIRKRLEEKAQDDLEPEEKVIR